MFLSVRKNAIPYPSDEAAVSPSAHPEATAETEKTEAPTIEPKADTTSDLEVHFIDVGQSDAALLISGHYMLIDGGNVDEAALSRFRDVGATVYRTDLQGDIIVKSDGNELSITTEKNENEETNPTVAQGSENSQNVESQYIGNKNSKKFHRPSCKNLPAEKNRVYLNSRDEAIEQGFSPCANCIVK